MLVNALLLAFSVASEPSELLLPSYVSDVAGTRLSVQRGAVLLDDTLTAATLADALTRVPEAAVRARTAHERLWLGRALTYGGMAGVFLGVMGVAAGAAQVTNSGAQWGLSSTGGILALAGAAAWVVGGFAINDGLAKVLEAVNLYNVAVLRPTTPAPPESSP